MSSNMTIPGPSRTTTIKLTIPPGMAVSERTCVADFGWLKRFLSHKPLRRPARLRPIEFTNDRLKRIAKNHPPPKEWLDGEEASPF
jgi:hypothetical protein